MSYQTPYKNQFKSNAIDLARATYLPLDQAAIFGEKLGFTLDTELSSESTMVFVDQNGQPTIAHRGSVTAKDWLVDDVLIAAGSNRETERLRRARQITAAAEAKYKEGLDINSGSRLQNGTRQTDYWSKSSKSTSNCRGEAKKSSQPVFARPDSVPEQCGEIAQPGKFEVKSEVSFKVSFIVVFFALVILARH
ncbi:hypothetical protein T492DRAFT_843327 [Pavlovales sp. CCMP2436]|nr:hypothetical protein T492DRAFT_843327 [Pavlovales sp. CCMP2436]